MQPAGSLFGWLPGERERERERGEAELLQPRSDVGLVLRSLT